ncbi:hypothetical protein EP51_43105 (plasmid) [Rhodococcus opacus]|uniref:Protein tyrosine phosphatase n=1 Tax=Rhodococcus opacus TaxID=37919 RepID=A0A076F5I0_RHOOP|nr:hypothetical protein EP51_43105 [Rhodococcus opacus]
MNAQNVELRQVVNLRDLGNLPVGQGGITRPGVLYRSDAPYPSDLPLNFVHVSPPPTVVDLRAVDEVSGDHPWEGVVDVRRVPLLRRAAVLTAAEGVNTGVGDLYEIYQLIVTTESVRVASLLSIAAHSIGPTLLHCAAGKDRTGIAIAILLLAAGVTPEVVIDDFTATAANMERLLARLEQLGRRIPGSPLPSPEVLGTPVNAMEMVIEAVTDTSGSVDPWLVENGVPEADIDTWRRRFVNQVPSV